LIAQGDGGWQPFIEKCLRLLFIFGSFVFIIFLLLLLLLLCILAGSLDVHKGGNVGQFLGVHRKLSHFFEEIVLRANIHEPVGKKQLKYVFSVCFTKRRQIEKDALSRTCIFSFFFFLFLFSLLTLDMLLTSTANAARVLCFPLCTTSAT
jgi:hypothetical protein